MGIVLLSLAGCRKEEEKTVDRSSPASYMEDKAFTNALAVARGERQELMAMRAKLVSRMKAMVDAKKAELKTDDPKAVLAELEKDPEWKSLYQRCIDANQAIKDNRKKTLGIVRERIAPEKKTKDGQISK